MDKQSKPTRILIIRSATRIFHPTLQALKNEFPNCRISVLAPESVQDAVAQDPLVEQVLPIGNNGRMSLLHYGRDKVAQLRKRRFDLAVSLYNVDHGLGYSNIDLLAWASKAKEIRGYNPRGSFVRHTGKSILKKFFLEKTTLVWFALNFLATGILFSLITLGVAGEWCVRKLLGRSTAKVVFDEVPERQAIPAGNPSKIVAQN